jgi:hypothetical protein
MTSEALMTDQGGTLRDVSQYAAILNGEAIRNELSGIFHGMPEDLQGNLLRYHINRCVFDLKFRIGGSSQNVIAKFFTTDRSDVFSAMEKIHQAGFGSDSAFAVPKPIAYIPSLGLLLEEKVEGKQVKGILSSEGKEAQAEAARRSGEWLARFHSNAPRTGSRVVPSTFLEHIHGWADQVVAFSESTKPKCDLLMAKLGDAIPEEGTFEYRPGHGSYIPSHVLINGGQTITIDFDEFELVDPSRDVAWFLISMQRLALKNETPFGYSDHAGKAFVDAYTAAAGEGSLRHLQFYKAGEYLHRARHDLYKRIPPVPAWADIMLDEAIRGLPDSRR